MHDVASKAADNAARLAALFSFFEYGLNDAISESSFNKASLIILWHLNESRRFFEELALPPELANAARLEEWAIAYCQKHKLNYVLISVFMQYGPSNLRKSSEMKSALKELQELNRARLNEKEKPSRIEINPILIKDRGLNMAIADLVREIRERQGTANFANPANNPYLKENNLANLADSGEEIETALISYKHSDDDRRYCHQCKNLTRSGLCRAAERGELLHTAKIYRPVTHVLRRCTSYLPRGNMQEIWV